MDRVRLVRWEVLQSKQTLHFLVKVGLMHAVNQNSNTNFQSSTMHLIALWVASEVLWEWLTCSIGCKTIIHTHLVQLFTVSVHSPLARKIFTAIHSLQSKTLQLFCCSHYSQHVQCCISQSSFTISNAQGSSQIGSSSLISWLSPFAVHHNPRSHLSHCSTFAAYFRSHQVHSFHAIIYNKFTARTRSHYYLTPPFGSQPWFEQQFIDHAQQCLNRTLVRRTHCTAPRHSRSPVQSRDT
jgi:hypothetical protein